MRPILQPIAQIRKFLFSRSLYEAGDEADGLQALLYPTEVVREKAVVFFAVLAAEGFLLVPEKPE
jgi:hypothetical protein